ncbi:aminoacyl-histidine dipeptidase [uncultured Desulfosarcina sp.]|uniref:aminoacyl-histidine dipeptidase n=1 Tax=uncultured Desulfosarcina sp. TaxID=218289 RepID=UPI0029C766E3|nr:aminoacyl-histidine dipeptidase [uncultured Desulfosarcina sp.]
MDAATRTVIDYFEKINRIPRCSKNEQQISRWLQDWASERGWQTESDAAGNLVVRVPASKGFEQAPVVIIQGHVDMVCEKQAGSSHDFTKDPIRMEQKGDWLTARETTLGADNGIAVAMALALVDDPDVKHPPLELYFTVDEETGLTGVLQMDPGLLSGRILINLDSEDEGTFIVGCAGGRNTTMERVLTMETVDEPLTLLSLFADGMQGGHSGVDIAKHRANANKILARLLKAGMAVTPMRLAALSGGTGRNVIPRSCQALVGCRPEEADALKEAFEAAGRLMEAEYRATDPKLSTRIEIKEPVQSGFRCASQADTAMVVNLILALPSGPVEMSPDFPLLVQTSANLSMIEILDDRLQITSSQRSSVPSRLDAVCQAVEAAGMLAGAEVSTNSGYPSWPVNRESPLLERCESLYLRLFDTEPTVQVMHAGLECGVIGNRCPGMDMVSLGPTMENPHSPSERLYLPSVEKVWRLMVALLASFESEG